MSTASAAPPSKLPGWDYDAPWRVAWANLVNRKQAPALRLRPITNGYRELERELLEATLRADPLSIPVAGGSIDRPTVFIYRRRPGRTAPADE